MRGTVLHLPCLGKRTTGWLFGCTILCERKPDPTGKTGMGVEVEDEPVYLSEAHKGNLIALWAVGHTKKTAMA